MWEKVPIAHMHLAFLTAEFDDIGGTTPGDAELVTAPDLDDTAQNARRRQLLYSRRGPLLDQVPGSTEWFDVRYLERGHLHQLRAINHRHWSKPGVDRNEVLKVADRMRIPLRRPPSDWVSPILWGHTRKGPFTVLEGNNRLVAYAAMRHEVPLRLRVYVGLSAEPCCWHTPDHL